MLRASLNSDVEADAFDVNVAVLGGQESCEDALSAVKASPGNVSRGCIVAGEVMPWLADIDVGAARGFARMLLGARTSTELRRRALPGLVELVPADVLTWDHVELATGAVRHEAVPAEAEPPGAFTAIVGDPAAHPLLCAHVARRRRALRLSDAVEHRRLSGSELYGDLLHPSGVEYCIAIGVRTERREMVVAGLGRTDCEFSERDRDVLDLVRPALEAAVRDAEAYERLVRALASDPPPCTAVVLLDRYGEVERSSLDAERGSASTSGRPSTLAGCREQSPRCSLCRRARRSSACETGGASPSTCCPETRMRYCSRRRSRALGPDATLPPKPSPGRCMRAR